MRPSRFTADVQTAILAAVAAGVPRAEAARLAGVGPSTLFAWLRRGATAKAGPFREFLDAIKRADAQAVADRVRAVRAAADAGTWQAAAWWLERRHPAQFGRHRVVRCTRCGRRPGDAACPVGASATTRPASVLRDARTPLGGLAGLSGPSSCSPPAPAGRPSLSTGLSGWPMPV